jgi:hypothetical protein
MLPPIHQKSYQNLLALLSGVQEQLQMPHPPLASVSEQIQQVQQVFAEQIATLSGEEFDPAIAMRWQSLQTEIHRALRLLATDLLFLRSSQKAATAEQRLANVRDRVEKIIGYCQVLITHD